MGRFAGSIGSLREKLEAVTPHLNERQHRILYAAEARQLGRGGIATVARAAGVSKGCVRRGLAELDAGEEPDGRVRRPGAGRPALAVKDPTLVPALLALVEGSTQGDPMKPLTWTTKSLRRLADELAAQGRKVGRDTVAALLKTAGFSLRGNARVLAGSHHPDRDAQFRHLNATVAEFLQAGEPVISVDTKKKEQIGLFARPGREWAPPALRSRSSTTTSPPTRPAPRSPTASTIWAATPVSSWWAPTTTPPHSPSPACAAGGRKKDEPHTLTRNGC
jgi:hypothetical protein